MIRQIKKMGSAILRHTRTNIERPIPGKMELQLCCNDDFPAVKTEMGWSYENHMAQAAEVYNKYANPFSYYERIIDTLLTVDGLSIVPLYDLFSLQAKGRRVIGLRHDMDMDPDIGVRCARYLAMKGICGSFYLLHTNPYYGVFYRDYFIRNPLLTGWIKSFIVAGCELGLHNDSMHIYCNHNLSGSAVLKEEIRWLRYSGAVIRGTVAHNSGPIYRAENYEIFRGRKLWDRTVTTPSGRAIPLGIISEEELGLTYEGTFTKPRTALDKKSAYNFFADSASSDVRSEAWMKAFLLNNPTCEFSTDFQFWLVGKDRWIIAGSAKQQKTFMFNVDFTDVLNVVLELPPDSRSIFVIHPEYVRGCR